ncbi:unnamed protein product [Brassica napus]|uniref:(rape) hypothetical protein n=1 Tax=Brassica napus TaxID=3708 RepID=A0A816J0Z5_BRANA|nr:unnamed protein product [Brassica napus]
MTLSHPVRSPETSSSGDAYPVSLSRQRLRSDIFIFQSGEKSQESGVTKASVKRRKKQQHSR